MKNVEKWPCYFIDLERYMCYRKQRKGHKAMKKYALNIDDRKVLVSRLMELTGLHSRYTFMPRCAYIVGSYTVEKEGTLVIEDNAAPEIIRTLLDEGIIREEGAETPETPETDAACGETTESECEESDETVDSTEDTQPTEESGATAEESPEVQEPVDESEPMVTVNDTNADEAPAPTEQLTLQDVDELTISLPMSGHTAQSIRNFLNLMYSRGPLLNKAMGTNFSVSNSLLDALEQATTRTVGELLDELEEYRLGAGTTGMTGICITAEKISLAFAGPLTQEKVSAYTELCAAMNRMASAQKRIQAKTVNDANEKYALRIWLIRLGLNGDEHKSIRKLLMQNLSGHAAFRTEEDAEKFRVKEKAKRDALKAAKQAAHGGVSAAEETAEAAAEAPTQPDCGADGAPRAQEAGA